MSIDPVGAIAGAFEKGAVLLDGILSRADRDAIESERNRHISELQKFYAKDDLDSVDFRNFVDRVFNNAGLPITPTRDVDAARREFIHTALRCAIELMLAKKTIARMTASLLEATK